MPDPTAPSDNTDPPPVAPIEPDFEACCGNGCEPCIFDIYAMERERYLVSLRDWQARRSPGLPGAGGHQPPE
jgi:hypothetical protein